MNAVTILLLSILTASVFFNVLNVIKGFREVKLIKSNEELKEKVGDLSNLLLSSTSNLNQVVADNSKLKSDISKLKNYQEELFRIGEGSKVLISQDLTHTSSSGTKTSFSILYEAEVLESSLKQVKVKAIDFTSSDSFANDPVRRKSIIDFINGKWFKKSDCELIIDEVIKRDA
jgi:hypothetical protein